MDEKTKVLILTSDEQLIQRISSNKRRNTHIIDLDDNQQISQFIRDEKNIFNLAFLAQLSENNDKNDLIYKRTLHSSDHHRKKSMKMSMICAICGDQAVGFNFDVLSCAACKTFFYRNAHQNLEKLKCLTGENECLIEYGTRRNCTKCRLNRCFNVGMRKERLRKIQTRSSTSDNSSSYSTVLNETLDQIDQLMTNINENDQSNQIDEIIWESLSIENIRTSFLTIFEKNEKSYSHVDMSNATNALITWSYFFNDLALRFISFFRQIHEFENLHGDDRFILIKNNLFSIYPISRCFNLKSINDYSSYDENDIIEKHRQLLILCGASNNILQQFLNSVLLMVRLFEQDSTLLILLLTILIFTHRLSMNDNETPLNDPLSVYRAQSHYTKLLWNYLINKHGELQGLKQFIQIFNIILRIQSLTKIFQDFFRTQMMLSATVESIAPLMQTVLHIS